MFVFPGFEFDRLSPVLLPFSAHIVIAQLKENILGFFFFFFVDASGLMAQRHVRLYFAGG